MTHHHNLRPRLGDTPPGPDQIKRWEDFGIPLAEDQIAEVLNLSIRWKKKDTRFRLF